MHPGMARWIVLVSENSESSSLEFRAELADERQEVRV